MGYYLRYLVGDRQPVRFADLVDAFGRDGYGLEGDDAQAAVLFRGDLACDISFNTPGDGLFEDEIQDLTEEAAEADGARRADVLGALNATNQIVAVQVLFAARQDPGVLDPLLTWLSANRVGLLQADGEGYYDGTELILATD